MVAVAERAGWALKAAVRAERAVVQALRAVVPAGTVAGQVAARVARSVAAPGSGLVGPQAC